MFMALKDFSVYRPDGPYLPLPGRALTLGAAFFKPVK
jgi:hypothetical protein